MSKLRKNNFSPIILKKVPQNEVILSFVFHEIQEKIDRGMKTPQVE